MDAGAKLIKVKVRRLTLVCLGVWLGVSLLPVLVARHPDWQFWGWPLDFWMAAQGSVLVYLALVVYYAWQVNRWELTSGESACDTSPGPQA